jgi:hypothetical protein
LDSELNGNTSDPVVETFLASMGLERFAAAFASEDVNIESLKLMTDSDLVDLGLTKVPRVKVLNWLRSRNPPIAQHEHK